MPWARLKPVFAALLMTTALAACEQPRPIPPGTDRFYYGHLVEGEKFGVSVGMSQDEAVRILTARGLRDAGLGGCTYSLTQRIGCDANEEIYIFLQKDFGRDGLIYLKIIDGFVDSIAWSFVIVNVVF